MFMTFDLEAATQNLVAGLNGLTFDGEDGNAEYVRKITPLIRSALHVAYERGRRDYHNELKASEARKDD